MKSRIAFRYTIVAILAGALATACGGGGSTSPMTEAEFCSRAADLQNSNGDITPEAVSTLADLAERAPTTELRDALGTLLPIWRKLVNVDTEDPTAFMTMLAEFDTPEIDAAGQVLDAYATDVCGLPDDTSASDTSDDSTDSDATGDTTDATTDSDTTDPYDQIDFMELVDAIDGLLPVYGDVTATTGTSMSGLFPGAEIIIPFDVEGDGLALCNGVLDWISARTDDPNVVIRIQVNGTDTVTRMAGGNCAEV